MDLNRFFEDIEDDVGDVSSFDTPHEPLGSRLTRAEADKRAPQWMKRVIRDMLHDKHTLRYNKDMRDVDILGRAGGMIGCVYSDKSPDFLKFLNKYDLIIQTTSGPHSTDFKLRESDEFSMEGFEKPRVRPFRKEFLIKEIIAQFNLDHPDVHCPLTVQDFHMRSNGGGSTVYTGMNGYGLAEDDDRWGGKFEYWSHRAKGAGVLHISGIFRNDTQGLYYHFNYIYDKKTEVLSKELNEAVEDDFGDMDDFEVPPRAKDFNKKIILNLVLRDIKLRFLASPVFTPANGEFRRCSARSGSPVPAWRWRAQRENPAADMQVEVDPLEDKTEANIFVTVRWGLENHKYTHVENKYYHYVKGANELSGLKED